MSGPTADDYLPRGARGSSKASPANSQNYITGGNRQGTSNGWNTPFYQKFISDYQKAMSDGSATRYFLNRKTGIATVDQEGEDDNGQVQQVRAGDVFDKGQKIGNLYERYTKKQADLLMMPLMLSAKEQQQGVTVDQKRAETGRDINAAASRQLFDERVQQEKDRSGNNVDVWAPVGGGVGGAVIGASAGAAIGGMFGGVGAIPGAVIGGVIGGLGLGAAGAAGAYANRDELEDLAARNAVQARMADKDGLGLGGVTARVTGAASMLGEFTNPLKQVVHGVADSGALGQQGDDRSGFYAQDPTTGEMKRDAIWTAADLGAGVGGALLQFASPTGAVLFQGQMLGQIGGKTGTMAVTGGKTFDDRSGTFDNVFTDSEGKLDVVSGLAGIGDIGIDVIQLGMGRGLMQAAGGLGRSTGSATLSRLSGLTAGKESVAGYRFTTETIDGVTRATSHRLTASVLAPSEAVQAIGARASALLARGNKSGAITSDDMYRAARSFSSTSNVRKAALVNAFGEGGEEAVQALLEPISHGAAIDPMEVWTAGLMGAATGAGKTMGSRVDTDSQATRAFNKASILYESYFGVPLDRAEWDSMSEEQRRTRTAVPDWVAGEHTQVANVIAKQAMQEKVAGQVGIDRYRDWQHLQVASERSNANEMIDGTYVIAQANHNIDDHMVVASIDTVVDLFERQVQGLAEQVQTAVTPEEQAFLQKQLSVLTGDPALQLRGLLPDLRSERDRFNAMDPATQGAEQKQLVTDMNNVLQMMYEVAPGAETTAARAVSLSFLRNPADNPGSFQQLLPQVSLENSQVGANNFLQLTHGPLQAMGGDFDGDKVSLTSRVVQDEQTFANLRMGRNLIGLMTDAKVNILQRVFEKDMISVLSAAWHDPATSAHHSNADATIKSLETWLTSEFPFAAVEIDKFVEGLQQGRQDAKKALLNDIALHHPEEIGSWSELHYRNPWFLINSRVQRELQAFQFSSAASSRATTEAAVKSNLALPIIGGPAATIIAERSATFSQTLFNQGPGQNLFRNFQSLHYSKYSSPASDTSVEPMTALQEMAALYERISGGMVNSSLDQLFSRDEITARVVREIESLAKSLQADFGGQRAAAVLLANMYVPNIQADGTFGQERITLLQWLLRKSVDDHERKNAGKVEGAPELAQKYASLRNMNAGQAFAEVYNGFKMRDILGPSGDVLGAGKTVGQWVLDYVNQDDNHRQDVSDALKNHSEYLARNSAQGKHNLPYGVDDLQGDTPITAYQAMTDALLMAGNTTLSWDPRGNNGLGKAHGRIGEDSNRRQAQFEAGIRELQAAAARLGGFNLTSVDQWRTLLDRNPDMGQAVMALIPDSAVNATFRAGQNGQVLISNWVYEMLAQEPKAAAMTYFRHSVLASWRSLGKVKQDDGPSSRDYSSLKDRMHQLIYRLQQDTDNFSLEQFEAQLFKAQDVDAFIGWVNMNVREDEAPYTAWHRDVAELDSSATQGGWSRVLEGSTQREAIRTFHEKSKQFAKNIQAEQRWNIQDAATFVTLQAAVKARRLDRTIESTPELANLERALEFARKYVAPLGPAAMQRGMVGALYGLFGNATDKGKSASMFEVNGVYDGMGNNLMYGTPFEQVMSSLTSFSWRDAGAHPSLLLKDGRALMDSDGRPISWEGLDAETFVDLWGQKDDAGQYPNRPLLRAILFPSAYEHTLNGRLDQRFLTGLSLTNLVQGHELHDQVYGNDHHSRNVYLAYIEGTAGDQAVQRYINELTISQTSSRTKVLTSIDEAQLLVQEAQQDLAEVLRMLAGYALKIGVTLDSTGKVIDRTNAVDALRVRMKEAMKKGRLVEKMGGQRRAQDARTVLKMWKLHISHQLATGELTDVEAREQLDQVKQFLETDDVQKLIRAYDPVLRRGVVQDYVRQHGNLPSQARWSTAVPKLLNSKLPVDPVTGLVMMTDEEWEEASRVIIAAELQERISTTLPGFEQVPIPGLRSEDLRLMDPSYGYLVDDLLNSESPMLKAALQLAKQFDHVQDAVAEADVLRKLETTIFSPHKFGPWTDEIVSQIQQGEMRIDASGSPQGIAQGGLGPQRGAIEGVATRRDFTVPDVKLLSSAFLAYDDLQKGLNKQVRIQRPGNPAQTAMPLGMLNGRFASRAVLLDVHGNELEDLLSGPLPAGIVYGDPTVSDEFLSVTVDRLRWAVDRFCEQPGSPERSDVSVHLEFFHPFDQPAALPNNLWFEGVTLDDASAMYGSLDEELWFAPGGLDPEASATALGAAKKGKKAQKTPTGFSMQQKLALEADFETDLAAVLQRKALRLVTADLGDGTRLKLRPSFNAVLKKLKMRHFVRGINAAGFPTILSAEQVMEAQRLGTFDLQNPELWIPSDPALRTMLGETGVQGEPRLLDGAPDTNLLTTKPWQNQVTPVHLNRLKGVLETDSLGQLVHGDLFKTPAINRNFQTRVSRLDQLDNATRAKYLQGLILERELASVIGQERKRFPDRKMFGDASRRWEKFTTDAVGKQVHVDLTAYGLKLPSSGRYADGDRYISDRLVKEQAQQMNQTEEQVGWIYRHIEPAVRKKPKPAFGELVGLQALENTGAPKATWIAPGDPVTVDLSSFGTFKEEDQAIALKAVLRRLMDMGATIALVDGSGDQDLKAIGSRYLRDYGFKRMDGSNSLFQRANPADTPVTVRARYDWLRATRQVPTYNRVPTLRTKLNGLEENGAWRLDIEGGQHQVEVMDMVQVTSWPNFTLPTPEQMESVRLRLSTALTDAIELSKIANKGEVLDPREARGLQEALAKASVSLNNQGLYDTGVEFKTGDIIPLISETGHLILYRHGHVAPTQAQLLEMFSGHNTAIYSPKLEDNATVHTGTVLNFYPTGVAGLKVHMLVPLQALADKIQFEAGGGKYLATAPPEGFRLPAPMKGKPMAYVHGWHDGISKEVYDGLVDNFQDAFTYLGIDFRPELARFFFGPNAVAEHETQVASLLRTLQRQLPKVDISVVDELIKKERLGVELRRQLDEVAMLPDFKDAWSGWVDALTSATPSVDTRIAKAMLFYLMTDDAQVGNVLSSTGLNTSASMQHGSWTREMPILFTQMFDRDTGDLRKHVVGKLNERFDNVEVNGKLTGYALRDDLTVMVLTDTPGNDITGDAYLQFVEARPSGDNPVLNMMSQQRSDSQTASAQQSAMAALTLNSRTASSRQLFKADAKLKQTNLNALDSGADLLKMLRDVPTEKNLHFGSIPTVAQREYDSHGRSEVRGLRRPLDTSGWDEKAGEVTKYIQARNDAIRSFGLSEGYAGIVDYWVRQHLYARVDAKPEEEGGIPGYVSFRNAMEAVKHIMLNAENGMLPVTDALVPQLHERDLALLHGAASRGGSFQLVGDVETKETVSEWIDWVYVALAIGDTENQQFDPLYLTATDGMRHTYRNAGARFVGLPASRDPLLNMMLLDPETSDLLLSVSPNRSASMQDAQLIAARSTLESIFGGSWDGAAGDGLTWRAKDPPASGVATARRKSFRWKQENHVALSSNPTWTDLRANGERYHTESTNQNTLLRIAGNLRAANALLNPYLVVGAPVEMFIQTTLENASNLLRGSEYLALTAAERRDMRLLYDALGHDQRFKTMIFAEFALDEKMFNAGRIEMFSQQMAKLGGKWQDPYYKMRSNILAQRYVESVVRGFSDLGTMTNITPMMVQRQLSTNPHWVQNNHPAIHTMAMNTIREMKNMKDTPFTLAWRGFVEPLTTSSRLGVGVASTIMLKLPYMFAGYTMNKAVQLLGLQGFSDGLALLRHGRRKGVLGQLQSFMAGRPYAGTDEEIDMSSVIETVDLTNAIIKSGLTHSGLMAMGLMMGNLGLSGEDEEDRRRKRAARYKGFSYIYDPRDIANDFRNADALYVTNIPFLSELFKVAGVESPGGERSMAQMNWIVKGILSPIIGMERFFNTGNPWEIWWGFQDAFYSFPLVNTTLVDDAAAVFAEFASSAMAEEAKGGPESLPKAFDFWVQGVMNLERMLFENSFINMLYVASDQYDRDPWALPERGDDSEIKTNRLGVTQKTGAMTEYIQPEFLPDGTPNPKAGEKGLAYKGREWIDAQVHGYAENRAGVALLGSLFTGFQGGFFRSDMVVKTRKFEKQEAEVREAIAIMRSLKDGVLKVGDPDLEKYYVSLDTRKAVQAEVMKELKAEGIKMGLTEYKAEQRMWDLWKGSATNPNTVAWKDVVWSQFNFENSIGYKEFDRYYQLNTTYTMGPDGKIWATGVKRDFLAALTMAPLNGYNVGDIGLGVDGRLNSVDAVRGINTGMRALEKINESFDVPPDEIAAAQAATNGYTPNAWQDFGNGWRNFGRGGGWGGFGGFGGGGGGSKGTPFRVNAPQDNQIPYANDVPFSNVNNTIIRRASIRRERVENQKGRLKPWQ